MSRDDDDDDKRDLINVKNIIFHCFLESKFKSSVFHTYINSLYESLNHL